MPDTNELKKGHLPYIVGGVALILSAIGVTYAKLDFMVAWEVTLAGALSIVGILVAVLGRGVGWFITHLPGMAYTLLMAKNGTKVDQVPDIMNPNAQEPEAPKENVNGPATNNPDKI